MSIFNYTFEGNWSGAEQQTPAALALFSHFSAHVVVVVVVVVVNLVVAVVLPSQRETTLADLTLVKTFGFRASMIIVVAFPLLISISRSENDYYYYHKRWLSPT